MASTVLNGTQYDLDAFKSEVDELVGATNRPPQGRWCTIAGAPP